MLFDVVGCRPAGRSPEIDSAVPKYYVRVPDDPDTVWLVVAVSRNGNKYVKTQNDGDQPNNLLKLPECPKT